MTITQSFWAGRRVLVTGHTGFKGGWLSLCLSHLGATVTGVALAPIPGGFHDAVGVGSLVDSHVVDLLDRATLTKAVHDADPEIVFHLAAQSLVIPSIEQPADTFATNVVGTANLLEAINDLDRVLATLVVTSDKVYANDGAGRRFVETDRLGGGDPYSVSKAATELVVASWRHTYGGAALATARAGNVIGGGDIARGRLLPDLLRSFVADRPVELRNPTSRRPWQFVLEPIAGYLAHAEALATGAPGEVPLALNFGPLDDDVPTVAEVADLAIRAWGSGSWVSAADASAIEAAVLDLDSTAAVRELGWRPVLDVAEAVGWTVDWLRAEAGGADLGAFAVEQVTAYRERARW